VFGSEWTVEPSGGTLTPSSGLLIVRIAWLAAILAGVLAVLVGLLSGTDGGPSSGSPQAAFGPGFTFEAQEKAGSAKAAAAREDRNQVAKHRIPAESRPSSGAPSGSAGQQVDVGGAAPTVTPRPEPEPAPQPRPAPTPRPSPTPPPPQLPVSPQPAPPQPAQPAVVANNNDGP
jgi:hypothetical protein